MSNIGTNVIQFFFLNRMQNFEVELHIDPNVKPIQAKVRNKPFHLRKAIEEEIKQKFDNDIIKEVSNEPTE